MEWAAWLCSTTCQVFHKNLREECSTTHRTGFKALLIEIIKGQVIVLNWSFYSISLWLRGNRLSFCSRPKWLLKFPFSFACLLMYINTCTAIWPSTNVTEYTFQPLGWFFFRFFLLRYLFFCCFIWLTTFLMLEQICLFKCSLAPNARE